MGYRASCMATKKAKQRKIILTRLLGCCDCAVDAAGETLQREELQPGNSFTYLCE